MLSLFGGEGRLIRIKDNNTMSKTKYISPDITFLACKTTELLMASQLTGSEGEDNIGITPTDENYDGEFQSRGWDSWTEEYGDF